jgi:hypothetical protein
MGGSLFPSAAAALQPFYESDPIIRRCAGLALPGVVAASQMESARGLVIESGRCFHYHHAGIRSLWPSFNLIEDGSATRPLWTVAGKAGQLVFRGEGAEEGMFGADWVSDLVHSHGPQLVPES